MKYLSICFLISLNVVYSNITKQHEKRLRNLKEYSMQDLEHENPGCPENSICSKEMGKRLKSFALHVQINGSKSKVLESYRKKRGIPVEFKIKQEKIKIFDAMAFKSQCIEDQKNDILIGSGFYKNLPKTKDLIFNEYILDSKKQFFLPLNASPFAIYKKKLLSALSIDDYIIYLESNTDGKWRITEVADKIISKASLLNSRSECKTSPCLIIWNQDKKKMSELSQINRCDNSKSRERKTSNSNSEK